MTNTASTPGTSRIVCAVNERPLDPEAIIAELSHPSAGAVVDFRGVVRDHDRGRGVVRLQYEAHPRAGAVLQEVVEDVVSRHPATIAAAAYHRIGTLGVGDIALVAAVASAHRVDAFALIVELVDAIKAHVPIWKHQVFTDGTDEWVNTP